MQPYRGKRKGWRNEKSQDDKGSPEVEGQRCLSGGRCCRWGRSFRVIEEFVAVATLDGLVLNLFRAIGAFFHSRLLRVG